MSLNRSHLTIAILTALSGLGLLVFFSMEYYDVETRSILADFRKDVDEKVIAIEKEIVINFETLYSLKGAFNGQEEISEGHFANSATEILSRHLHIQALEWIPRISRDDREAAERSRRTDFPDFEITERREQGLMSAAGDRADYFPVYYVEPMAGNELALGFDLGSDPTRRKALELARDTGELVATSSITLIQEQSKPKRISYVSSAI